MVFQLRRWTPSRRPSSPGRPVFHRRRHRLRFHCLPLPSGRRILSGRGRSARMRGWVAQVESSSRSGRIPVDVQFAPALLRLQILEELCARCWRSPRPGQTTTTRSRIMLKRTINFFSHRMTALRARGLAAISTAEGLTACLTNLSFGFGNWSARNGHALGRPRRFDRARA